MKRQLIEKLVLVAPRTHTLALGVELAYGR